MGASVFTERQARTQHRHELRTLTYVTFDQANGGIVRNLNQHGIGAQVVAAVRPQQQLRIRFELRGPRLRVETRGEVAWSTPSGQCGIRFLDLPSAMRRQINEWILGDLLEGIALHVERSDFMFPAEASTRGLDLAPVEEDDGLLVSATPSKIIPLPAHPDVVGAVPLENMPTDIGSLDWLSQPFSPRGIARAVDALAIVAALLLFTLVFLSVTREAPPWPFAMIALAGVLVALMYRGFFWVVGGESLGTRLARRAGLESLKRDQTEE
jgi:PilZ domain